MKPDNSKLWDSTGNGKSHMKKIAALISAPPTQLFHNLRLHLRQPDDVEFVSQAIDAHRLAPLDLGENHVPMTTPQQMLSFQDDRMLGGGARGVMADFNQFFSKNRLEHAGMLDERVRLARELHDGLLQSL